MTAANSKLPCVLRGASAADVEAWLHVRLDGDAAQRLARQGFVSRERRPSGALVHKLRYREAGGRQRVLYLGVDPLLARAVEHYLSQRQRQVRRRRRLHALRRRARAAVAQWRAILAPRLAAAGYAYHGRQLRQSRSPLPDSRESRRAARSAEPTQCLERNYGNEQLHVRQRPDRRKHSARAPAPPDTASRRRR